MLDLVLVMDQLSDNMKRREKERDQKDALRKAHMDNAHAVLVGAKAELMHNVPNLQQVFASVTIALQQLEFALS